MLPVFARLRRLVLPPVAVACVSALLVGAGAAGAWAQAAPTPLSSGGLDMTNGSAGPVEVEANNGIEWQQGQQRFIARGNAVATRGSVSIHADELIAYYGANSGAGDTAGDEAAQAAGMGDIKRLEAHGTVTIVSPTETASGTDAVYDLQTGLVTLTSSAGPVRLETQKETVTARDALEYDVRNQVAVARGDARMIQGERVLHAQLLTARLITVNGHSELQTVDATGGVLITTEKETARGSQGKYNAKTGIATLTGSVTLTRGQNVLQGGMATVNMKTGVSSLSGSSATDGKARAVFSPGKAAPTQ
jgi:lipopolysaccharide export system protein LptA